MQTERSLSEVGVGAGAKVWTWRRKCKMSSAVGKLPQSSFFSSSFQVSTLETGQLSTAD